METGEPTLTVTELNTVARAAVQAAFGTAVWVRGEVQRLVRSKPGHVYFDLVEKDELRDRVRAKVRVALFRDDRRSVERRLVDAGVELTDDVEVRIAARPGFYVERGEFQLVMHGVDPDFTVGRLAANRDRLLRLLGTEGLLRANEAHPIPLVPLRIGLVSSGGTAAYHDFVEELGGTPFAWRVIHADVRVQGNVAPRRLARAVRQVGEHGVDVIVLVRGGGARTDLAAYDSEPLARAIAAAPVPVLTGIGHEIDRTVADEVAHTAHKTPTACARALVEAVEAFHDRVEHLAARVALAARGRVATDEARLVAALRRTERGARTGCRHAQRDLAIASRRLGRAVPAGLARADARRRDRLRRLVRAVPRQLDHRDRVLGAVAGRLVRTGPRRVASQDRDLAELATRIARAAPRHLGRLERAVPQVDARVRALDPRRVLERGFSITRDARGRAVRAVDQIEPGDELVTELGTGSVTSRVERTRADTGDKGRGRRQVHRD